MSQPWPASSTETSVIYQAVASALGKAHVSPLRIEILLETHPLADGSYVEIDDQNIWIPKRVLVQAYVYARHVFFSTKDKVDKHTASSVLLLLNAEHLTAANFRKQYATSEQDDRMQHIQADLSYMESMFRSPLNRNTKSPTLWGHRRWLINQSDQGPLFKDELSVVLAAAETHPRNFYAWSHLRWFIIYFEEHEGDEDLPGSLCPSRPELVLLLEKWCLQHPGDTSGWSFLYWLMTVPALSEGEEEDRLCQLEDFDRVIKAAMSLRLRNEALWGFLRALSANQSLPNTLQQTLEKNAKMLFDVTSGQNRSHSMRDITLWLQMPAHRDAHSLC